MAEEKRTVTVGCRIPNGITLRLFKPGQPHDMGALVQYGPAVTLKGPHTLGAGFGNTAIHGVEPVFTEGVDEAFFKAWVEQNDACELLAQGLIFPVETPAEEGERSNDDLR